jgi:hypothetical protein
LIAADADTAVCCPVPQLQHIFLPLKLAHHHLSHFQCREALQALGALPERQRCSAGVLLLIGRCLYELVDYARAAEAFEAARTADPLSLEVSGWWRTPPWRKITWQAGCVWQRGRC